MSESATAATTSSSQSATAAAAAAGAKFQSASLYVGDLHPDTTEAQLIERFSTVGSVVLVRVCRDKITRQSLGYAYVNYSQPSEAERALDTLNFEPLNGRPMRIMWSQRDPALRKSGVGNVFIKNLDSSIDNKSLYDTFSSFGEIISCKIITDEQNNSKGYGFVHYETKEAADRAARSVNNMIINGKKVFVGPFLSRNERASTLDTMNPIFTNLYVKNFDVENTTEEKLRELFGKYGEITSIKLIQENGTGKLMGFGFINYKNADDAATALKELNETELDGKKLYVSRFQKKNERTNFLKNKFEEKRVERLKKFAGVNLYVKNLDDKVDDEKLRKEFAEFGTITSVKVMSEHGRSKGFGFVCYSSSEEATRAVTEMNGKIVGTKPLYVAIAQRKDDRKRILAAQFRERLQTSQFILQQFYNQPLGQQQAAQVQPASAAQNSLYYQYQNQLGMNRYMAPNANPAALNSLANAPYSANPAAGYPNPPVRGAVPRWQMNYFPQQQYSGIRSGVTPMQQQQMGYNRNMMNAQSRALSSQQQMQYPGAVRYPANSANMNQMRMKAGANLPGQQMPAQQPSAAATINVPGQEPLTTAMLAEAQPQEQKQLIGERLYPLIQSMHAEWAGKITGMLLEIDNAELLHMLDSPESLRAKVEEAVLVLQNHQEKQAMMQQ